MPEIPPEQRAAAWQAIRKWTAAIGSGPQDPDYAIDALIAEGWGPVADAEARGYRAGVEAAADRAHGYLDKLHPPEAWPEEEQEGYNNGCCDMSMAIESAIRALADKPKETPHG